MILIPVIASYDNLHGSLMMSEMSDNPNIATQIYIEYFNVVDIFRMLPNVITKIDIHCVKQC